jgi:hypothetical protein
MSDHLETEQEIQQEMEELGIDNHAEGRPDVLMSGAVIRATVAVLLILLVAGSLLLVF